MHPRLGPPNPASHVYRYSPQVTINYEIHGRGRPMVLLHGFGASLETWRDITPLLPDGYTLYLLDLKGFGRSSKPDDHHYSADDQAQIVKAFLEAVVREPATIVGNSLGGAIALKTYLASSGLPITSLVLIDSAAYQQRLPLYIAILRWPVINHIVLVLPAKWRARTVLKQAFYDTSKITEDRVERHAQFLDLPGSHSALIATANELTPGNLDSFIRQLPVITAPTLIVWGRDDRIIPVENAERFHRDLKNSALTVFEMTGHIPQEERPELTAIAIKRFLESH